MKPSGCLQPARFSNSKTEKQHQMRKKIYAIIIAVCSVTVLVAQPAGWSYVQPLQVQNNTASLVTNYQLQFTFNTQTPVGAGQMNANGDDIRFGKDCAGTTLFNYWIESGMNTPTTVIWVKIDSLPASGTMQFYMFYGNASATAASAVVGTFIGPHSSTDSVVPVNSGGVANSQRGFRFSPNETILMTHVGKYEPNGTTRTVTLFNFTTQAILSQQTVSGPAAQYSYNPLTNPMWLTQGTQYLLVLYQGASDGYYYGTSSQIGQHLTYYDMRYCNSCGSTVFPTSTLSNYQYGQPDMWYFTKQNISVAPTVTPGSLGSGTLITSTSGAAFVCPGDSAFVSITASGGTGAYSYQWLPTTGMANPNAASTMVLPPTSGMYYCIVTDQCGNSNFDSVYVTINTPPTITASVSTDSVCIGGSFTATGSGAVSYVWSGGVVDGVPFTPSATSNYTVTGTDANGCTNIAIAAVEVLSLPVVNASVTDNNICLGDSVVFNGSGAATYVWDNGVTDNVPYAPSGTATYMVTGTDAYGCIDTASLVVNVNAVPDVITNSSGSPYCAGGSASLSASGADIYTWMPGPVTGSTIVVNPTVTTTYTVTGTDTITGCVDTVSLQVVVNPNPVLTVTSDSACTGTCSNLLAVGSGGSAPYTYNWTPAVGLSNPSIPNPVACNSVTTCYTVTVTDANGCTDVQLSCQYVSQTPVVSLTGPQNTCITDGSHILFSQPASAIFSGPGMTNNLFSPSTAGLGTHMIYLTYTDPNTGCTGVDSMAIVVSPCVGIADNNANEGIDVYPNPFGSQLIINLSDAGHVRMFNNLGQVVFEQEMNAGRNEISTSEFPVGIYTLEVVNENETTTIKVVHSAQ